MALSPLATAAGFAAGHPFLLPVLSAGPAFAAMALLLRHGSRGRAVGAMLLWAGLLAFGGTVLSAAMPERATGVVLHGAAYWEEMRGWLETGLGRESDPGRFLPQHLLHAGAFVALSLASGSLLSIVFGAVLMQYMAFYAARVALETPGHPVLAGFLAWPPWSLIRIASFVVLGVVLAEPVLSRLHVARASRPGSWRPWVAIAAGGLLLDALLKALLAPHWAALLRSLR